MPLHKIRVVGLIAISLVLGFVSNAHALGLGSLQVDSFLNEPLSGKIEFMVADADELSTVTASIADKESFERLGVEYPDYIEDLTLSTSIENRKTFLLISSEQPIKEPFVHFIVEIEWSGGRFLREYTALIDPPVYAKSAPKTLAEPKVVGEDAVYSSPESSGSQELVTSENIQREELTIPEQQPVYEQVDEEATAGTEESVSDYVSDSIVEASGDTDAKYGPVVAGESLSVIAQGLQREFPDLSIYQIMKVLFEENRDAFIDDNINGLKKDVVLNISSIDKVREIDRDEGKALFYDHISRWTPPVPDEGGLGFDEAGISVSSDTYQYSDDSLELTDTAQDFSTPPASTEEDFRVGSSSNFGSSTSADIGTDEGRVAALRSEISELEVSLQSSQLENQELKERISILEGQINDLNRLVSLDVEDADLAAVQSALSEQLDLQDASTSDFADAEQGIADVSGDLGAASESLESDSLTEENQDAAQGFGEDSTSDAAGDTLVGDFAPTEDATSNIEEATEEVVDETVEAPAPVAPVSTFKQDEGIVSSIMSTISSLGSTVLAGIGALILLILGLIWYRRKQADEEFEVSMLSIDSYSYESGASFESDVASAQKLDDHPVNAITSTENTEIDLDTKSSQVVDVPSEQSEVSEQTKETSFLTVYSDSDAVVQADEVDPVAEADVYIAYGRFEQAEEVLKAGIEAEPERFDIKAKLLSMYQRTNKQDPFTRMAEDIFAQRSDLTPEQWAEVCEMGKEVDSSNPLFDTELDNSDLSVGETADAEVAISDGVTENDSNASEEGSEISEDIEVDLVEMEEESSSIEFEALDLSSANSIDLSSAVDSSDNDDGDELAADVIEFDDDTVTLSERENISEIDFSDSLDLSTDEPENDSAVEIDLESASVDSPAPDLEVSQSSFSENDSASDSRNEFLQEVSDIEIEGDYNEGKTQFDLAKVFVDLGDIEGAKKILKDIIENEANESEIISEAATLFNELDSQ
jgi:pilus assembly protein FimV